MFRRIPSVLQLWLCLAGPVGVQAQQANSLPLQTSWNGVVSPIRAVGLNAPTRAGELDNSFTGLKPAWIITRELGSGADRRTQAQRDLAVADSFRLRLLISRSLHYNEQPESIGGTEEIRNARVASQWHPSDVLKFDGVFGFTQVGAAFGGGGQLVRLAVMPITQMQAHFTPRGDAVKVDFGFNRCLYDLRPRLAATPVLRNDFAIRPEIHLPSGWNVSGRAETAQAASAAGSYAHYDSEITVAHELGKSSELHSTFGSLRNVQPDSTASFPPAVVPNNVQNLAGGWTTDLSRQAFKLSLDFGAGVGHERNHGENFRPWGLSLEADSDLTWKFRSGHEMRASYEFYYDPSEPSSVVTISVR